MSDLGRKREERVSYETERATILARRCQCVSCANCRGTGSAWYATGGYPEEDVETCAECSGSGITESCERCDDLEELERAFDGIP